MVIQELYPETCLPRWAVCAKGVLKLNSAHSHFGWVYNGGKNGMGGIWVHLYEEIGSLYSLVSGSVIGLIIWRQMAT